MLTESLTAGGVVQAEITGVGSHLPQRRMMNQEFSEFLDTSDEWIQSHTGIRSRYIASDEEGASDLGLAAALGALEDAGLDAGDLGLILVATSTGDFTRH